MKILILSTFIALLFTGSLFGQEKKSYISINSQFNAKDAAYSFNLNYPNLDSVRWKLVKYWKNPLNNSTGSIVWVNREIPYLGKELRVVLTDGICTKKAFSLKCERFSNKREKLINLKT